MLQTRMTPSLARISPMVLPTIRNLGSTTLPHAWKWGGPEYLVDSTNDTTLWKLFIQIKYYARAHNMGHTTRAALIKAGWGAVRWAFNFPSPLLSGP